MCYAMCVPKVYPCMIAELPLTGPLLAAWLCLHMLVILTSNFPKAISAHLLPSCSPQLPYQNQVPAQSAQRLQQEE